MGVEIAAVAIAALVPELRCLVLWYLRERRRRAGHGDDQARPAPPAPPW